MPTRPDPRPPSRPDPSRSSPDDHEVEPPPPAPGSSSRLAHEGIPGVAGSSLAREDAPRVAASDPSRAGTPSLGSFGPPRKSVPGLAGASPPGAGVPTLAGSSSPGEDTPRVAGLALPRERAAARLAAGTPLLHDQPLRLDLAFATHRLTELAQAHRLDLAAGARLDTDRLLTEAFVQHRDHVMQLAGSAGLDPALLTALAEQAVKPLRSAYASRLQPLVEQLGGWQRDYCPVCGAWPTRAEAPAADATHVLVCRACDLSWRSPNGNPAGGVEHPAESGFRIELAVPEDDLGMSEDDWEGAW